MLTNVGLHFSNYLANIKFVPAVTWHFINNVYFTIILNWKHPEYLINRSTFSIDNPMFIERIKSLHINDYETMISFT